MVVDVDLILLAGDLTTHGLGEEDLARLPASVADAPHRFCCSPGKGLRPRQPVERGVAAVLAQQLVVRALLDELSAGSERFRELWARGDVGHSTGIVHSRHPEVGDLFLHRTRLAVPHSGGQLLLIRIPGG